MRRACEGLGGGKGSHIAFTFSGRRFLWGLVGGLGGLFIKTAHGLRSGTIEGAFAGAAAGVTGVLLTPLAGATGAAASLLGRRAVVAELRPPTARQC